MPSLAVNSPLLATKSQQKKAPKQKSRMESRISVAPKSPVGRHHIHETAGYCVFPSVDSASSREHEHVDLVLIQNAQFEAIKEGGIEYGLPHDLDEALWGEG